MSPESKVQSPKPGAAASDKGRVAGGLTRDGTPVLRSNTEAGGRNTFRLSRYLSIYLALWKNSVTREMTFKSNFLLWIVVEILWFGLQLSFISVLYLHTDYIG